MARKMQQMFEIKIVRKWIFTGSIGGELYVNGDFLCYTLELPWFWNTEYKSCVPNGTYGAFVRHDGHLGWRIQLTGTAPRTYVQIHVGKWPRNSVGCVLVGMSLAAGQLLNPRDAVNNLRTASQQHTRPDRVVIEGVMATPAGDYPDPDPGERRMMSRVA